MILNVLIGIFSADGLAMCDPELIRWPHTNIAALYVCSRYYSPCSRYLLGHVVPSTDGYKFQKLSGMSPTHFEVGGGAGKG